MFGFQQVISKHAKKQARKKSYSEKPKQPFEPDSYVTQWLELLNKKF